jgi:hypothetical protein
MAAQIMAESVAGRYAKMLRILAEKLLGPRRYNFRSMSSRSWDRDLRTLHLAALAVQFVLGGCASLPQACLPPAQPVISADLFFGRSAGRRVVSETEFAAFLASEITPRFPDGLTVLEAHGQWYNRERGTIVREASKLVKIIFADDARKRADLEAIAASYRLKFHQQSVLISLQSACASF